MTIARILIIAGSDSGGGAGIQADIKTVTMLGGHATTAITAITAQNTLGVQAVHPVPTDMVIAQLRSVIEDIGVDAVKIGMIGSAETAHAVADILETLALPPHPGERRGSVSDRSQRDPGVRRDGSEGKLPIIFDPVMVATSGDSLVDGATFETFARLLRVATVVTPNLPELEALGGEEAVLARGPALLVKGGHAEGDIVEDRLIDADGAETIWTHPRRNTPHTHGTGCTLASGIATGLGQGMTLPDATARAIRYVQAALAAAPGIGGGHGSMGHALGRSPFDDLCPA